MNQTTQQFLRYAVVGGIGVIINLAITYALTDYFNLWYMASNALGISVAFLSNFTLNKYWTFKG